MYPARAVHATFPHWSSLSASPLYLPSWDGLFIFGPVISISGSLTDWHNYSGYSRERLVFSFSANLCASFISDVSSVLSSNCCTPHIKGSMFWQSFIAALISINLYLCSTKCNPCQPFSRQCVTNVELRRCFPPFSQIIFVASLSIAHSSVFGHF